METNETLQEAVESKIVRTTFHVSGLPETAKKKLDTFCNEHFGGCRWQMLMYFLEKEKNDNVMDLIVGEVKRAHQRIDNIEQKEASKTKGGKPARFGTER